jgi:hypothetical protein
MNPPFCALSVSLLLISCIIATVDGAVPSFTVGDPQVIPVVGKKTDYINDSTFPFLPDKAGTGRVVFWGDAAVIRYAGPDIEHMAPTPGTAPVIVTDAPGKDGSWHANGGWMLTATRLNDGSLVGFVHGEDHRLAEKKFERIPGCHPLCVF